MALGYAQTVAYPPDVNYEALFLQLQAEAQDAGLGLWANGEGGSFATEGISGCFIPAIQVRG